MPLLPALITTRSSPPTVMPGASHETYREYLEARYLDDFDAWRGKYRNPFSDLRGNRRLRNWDDELRNSPARGRRHRRRGRVPEHGAAVLPELRAVRPPAEAATSTSTGSPAIRAHNRWLADWCARFPERRAGHRPDLPERRRRRDRRRAVDHEHGLRGGVLISAIPPDVDYVKPLYDPVYEPLWSVCEDLGVKVNSHGGTGPAELRQVRGRRPPLHHRGLVLLAAAVRAAAPVGRVRTPPAPAVRHDRDGLRLAAADARALRPAHQEDQHDRLDRRAPLHRRAQAAAARERLLPPELLGRREPARTRRRPRPARSSVSTSSCGGATTRTTRAPGPTRANTCASSSTTPIPTELQQLLAGNAARLYDFSLDALAPLAAEFGPTVAELARPLDALPEQPNEALLKAVGGQRSLTRGYAESAGEVRAVAEACKTAPHVRAERNAFSSWCGHCRCRCSRSACARGCTARCGSHRERAHGRARRERRRADGDRDADSSPRSTRSAPRTASARSTACDTSRTRPPSGRRGWPEVTAAAVRDGVPMICHSNLTSGITLSGRCSRRTSGTASPHDQRRRARQRVRALAGHAANMLNPRITSVGVGVAYVGQRRVRRRGVHGAVAPAGPQGAPVRVAVSAAASTSSRADQAGNDATLGGSADERHLDEELARDGAPGAPPPTSRPAGHVGRRRTALRLGLGRERKPPAPGRGIESQLLDPRERAVRRAPGARSGRGARRTVAQPQRALGCRSTACSTTSGRLRSGRSSAGMERRDRRGSRRRPWVNRESRVRPRKRTASV